MKAVLFQAGTLYAGMLGPALGLLLGVIGAIGVEELDELATLAEE